MRGAEVLESSEDADGPQARARVGEEPRLGRGIEKRTRRIGLRKVLPIDEEWPRPLATLCFTDVALGDAAGPGVGMGRVRVPHVTEGLARLPVDVESVAGEE